MPKRKQVTEKFTMRCGHEDWYTHSGSPRRTIEQFLSHSGPLCSQCQMEQLLKERDGAGGRGSSNR